MKKIKLGIIICDHYRTCSGGKCFKALHKHEGAFEIYKDKEVELIAFGTCGGCPGTNMEYANDEMIKNGVTHIHFATCFLLGHPPCPHMANLEKLIAKNHGLNVTFGTHPIPQKYFIHHTNFKTWNNEFLIKALKPTLSSEKIRLNYD
ncbi:MAG: CGGC domain-containing protein [Paludibacter sp.]|nr:CGGC domain-containing protein [Paludibacter sp.]MBP7612624.1 CGGC domain-containing protein [Paludibacter sp.]